MDPSVESGRGCQDVNPQFLQQLRELDIPEEAAKQVSWYLQTVVADDDHWHYLRIQLEHSRQDQSVLLNRCVAHPEAPRFLVFPDIRRDFLLIVLTF